MDADLFLFPESSKSKKLNDTLNDQKIYGKMGSKGSLSPLKAQTGGVGEKYQKLDEKKSSKKKVTKKGADATLDANKGGAVLKKPLSAYMLYNNHRRPVLRSEYPSKWSLYSIGNLQVIVCC